MTRTVGFLARSIMKLALLKMGFDLVFCDFPASVAILLAMIAFGNEASALRGMVYY